MGESWGEESWGGGRRQFSGRPTPFLRLWVSEGCTETLAGFRGGALSPQHRPYLAGDPPFLLYLHLRATHFFPTNDEAGKPGGWAQWRLELHTEGGTLVLVRLKTQQGYWEM